MTRRSLFSILSLLAIPGAATALSPFPETAPIDIVANNTTYALQHVYSVQESVIPAPIWGFILLIGLAFLAISILVPERGELITGLLGLAFISMAWLQSAFLGTTEIATATLADNVVLIQPVTTIYASHWMPWLHAIVFFIAFGNVILAIGNFLRKPVAPYERPEVIE
jgi:hypothetical protein